jgi:hypothetical protein
LHGLDVVLVLNVECGFELSLEFFLVLDDLLALNDLLLDVGSQLLAVLFFFEFLPIPIDFYISLM